jgi:hypothetical protein
MKSPSSMRNGRFLTLPSIRASFKKWGCCTPILPKCQEVPHNSKQKKIKIKKIKKFENTDAAV